ncbi:hypothetical protein EON80_19680, partial [bacterium]
PVTVPIFTATIQSGAQSIGSGYVTLLDATPEQTRATATKPAWSILAQTPQVQAVRFEDGTLLASFFEAAEIPRLGRADRPCLLLFDGTQIWATDPLQTGGNLTLTGAGGQKKSIELPKNGTSVAIPWKL